MPQTTHLNYPLIIESSSHQPDTEKLESLSSQITDWNGLLTSAYGHGVYPLIAKSLKGITTVPDQVKTTLKLTNLDIARRNMMMTSEMLRIIKLLEENGIQSLAIKGPVLSQIIHRDVTSRQYADIDILIHQSDLWKAGNVLTQDDYIFEHDLKFLKNQMLLKVAKDIMISNPQNNINIEVHWKLFDGKLLSKSNLKLFHESQAQCVINHSSIATLDPTVNLLFLLVHGSKHLWERIEWIVDIDRIVRSEAKIDWQLIIESAKAMEIAPMVYLGVMIAHRMFGTPIPESMMIESKELMERAVTKLMLDIFEDKILLGEEEFLRDWRDIGLEEIKNKVLYSKLRRFKLTHHEIFEMNLPSFLSPLYYLFLSKRLFLEKYFPSKE